MRPRFTLAAPRVVELLRAQDGVVARTQLQTLGAMPHDIARLLRRRALTRVFPGVFVDHTGPMTPRQRHWAAVLAVRPAALSGRSALPGETPGVIEVAVAHGRKIVVPPGVRIRRTVDLDDRVQWNRSPPVVRIEHALLDTMIDRIADDDVPEAFAVLCRHLGARRTTPQRVLAALADRARVPHRALIRRLLTDVRDGVCSVLERGYRQRVERAHGLPRASRQHPSTATGALTRQDVRYRSYRLVIEMDGYAFHGTAAARDADALRDLAELATTRSPTARITYGLAFTHSCRTAYWIAELLHQRGWTGDLTPCPHCGQHGG